MARKFGLASAAAAFFLLLISAELPTYAADDAVKQHAVSLVGAPKFGPDYRRQSDL